MTGRPPLLAADLTYVNVNGGRAYSGLVDWDEDRDPTIGEEVLVANGGTGPLEAVITEVRTDGTLVLSVPGARSSGAPHRQLTDLDRRGLPAV